MRRLSIGGWGGLSLLILIAIMAACQSGRQMNRGLVENTASDTYRQQRRAQEIQLSYAAGDARDSLWHAYSLRIFPKDSFRFSPEGGFSGKAEWLELSGSLRQVSQRRDSVLQAGVLEEIAESSFQQERAAKEIAVEKERKAVGWAWWGLFWMGLFLVGVWWIWRGR